MVDPSMIGMVFAIIGVIATMIWYGLALLGIKKLDDVRKALSDSNEAQSTYKDSNEDPLEIIRERYAKGELSEEEFERMTDQLVETEGDTTDYREKVLDRD